LPCVWAGTGIGKEALDHILWTGYWALLYLHCMEYGTRAKDWLCVREDILEEYYGCQTSVASCQNIWLRIIETFSKRMCSHFRSPCLLHRITKKRISASQHTHSQIVLFEQNRESNIPLQNRSFIVVTSCLVTTNPRQPLHKPSRHASHINTPRSQT